MRPQVLPLLAVLAASQGAPAQDDKLLAAARQEAALTLYTSFAEKDLPPLVAAFEKKYGVRIGVWRAGSEKVLQRTLAEAAARRYEVDVIHSSALEMETLHREGILRPVAPPSPIELIAGALRPHRGWVATYLSVWVQAYNTRLVGREELPASFQDLLHPRWKGRLGIEANETDWYSTVVQNMGDERGAQFFRDLVARNGISVRSGHSLLANMVAAGEVPLALTIYNFSAQAAKRRGAAIDWFVLEPTVARMSGVGVARRAPHPNAALLFHDYMLSVEAQRILASMDYVPTNAAVPSPLAVRRYVLVDPAAALDQRDRWSKSFDEVILKGTGR